MTQNKEQFFEFKKITDPEEAELYSPSTEQGRANLRRKPIKCQVTTFNEFPQFQVHKEEWGVNISLLLAKDDFFVVDATEESTLGALMMIAFYQLTTSIPLQVFEDLTEDLQRYQEQGYVINPLIAEDGKPIDIRDVKEVFYRQWPTRQ